MSRGAQARLLLAPSALGAAGALLCAVSAPRALDDQRVRWWYHPGFPGSRSAGVTLVWVGVLLLGFAWLAIAALARRGAGPSRRQTRLLLAVWVIPLALAPPVFSRDVYSYLAQGTILHLGLNPYHSAPLVLRGNHGHVLAAVSPFWRHTTAPYGPLFLGLVALIVSFTGQHLIPGVLLCRTLDLVGLALIVAELPRLIDALGGVDDRGVERGTRAVWLLLASPLCLLALVLPAHNDLLMTGLLVAGIGQALRGRPLAGVVLCAVAGTIKVPALAGAVFIAVAWARAEPTTAARARLIAAAAAIILAILAAVTLATGVGPDWLSSAIFKTPAMVHLAITPATAVGYSAAKLLHLLGVHVRARPLESTLVTISTVVVGLVGLRLLARVRVSTLVSSLGIALVLAAAGGPAAWPWYLVWGLSLLMAQRSSALTPFLVLVLGVGGLLVEPNGQLALSLSLAPIVLIVYAGLLAAAWLRGGRRRTGSGGAATLPERELPEAAEHALAQSW